MVSSVHLVTSGSSAGRKTSTVRETTEIGYAILKILADFDQQPEFSISTLKPNVAGITATYVRDNPDALPEKISLIVLAELNAFSNMGWVDKKQSAFDLVGDKISKAQFTLTDSGRERITAYEAMIKARQNEPEVSEPEEDTNIVKQIHICLLAAAKAFQDDGYKRGGVKTYIVGNAIKNFKETRDAGNIAFEQLVEKGCLDENMPHAHMSKRFTLSSLGQHVLDEKPEKFPNIQDFASTQPPVKNHS